MSLHQSEALYHSIMSKLLFLFLVFFITDLSAQDCPVKLGHEWDHYADEWGHDSKKALILKRRSIRIGSLEGSYFFLPSTCNKSGCQLSFFLNQKDGCLKPLLSVEGKVKALRQGDWTRFRVTYIRSSVKENMKASQFWRFNFKKKIYEQEGVPATYKTL
jgi:hypothetical protein